MIRHFSMALGSTARAFKQHGVFDGFIEVDSKLYIDPHLLGHSAAPEIRDGAAHFRSYFEGVIRILRHAISRRAFQRQAIRLLTFREIPLLSLGYSKDNTSGNAIGPTLAKSIAATATEIIEVGIDDPEIFELIGLLEEKVGADRISDMTAIVIYADLIRYSQRIAAELQLSRRSANFRGTSYQLPFDERTSRSVILVPSDILRNLPVAHDWSDIDIVCSHNEALRRRVNKLIGRTWRNATRRLSKHDLRAALLANPGALRDLIDQYRAKPASPYDFDRDPAGEIGWYAAAQEYTTKFPLDLARFHDLTGENLYALVHEMCSRFKQLVENNGLVELLYNPSGQLKHERAAQLLFFGVADAYCEANNLDISREPNAGRGPVDFKVSRGYNLRVNVEVKYSSNTHLLDGYSDQLPTYDKAEKSLHSIFLVIRTGDHKRKLEQLQRLRNAALSAGHRAPDILIVDGRRRPSASKLVTRKK